VPPNVSGKKELYYLAILSCTALYNNIHSTLHLLNSTFTTSDVNENSFRLSKNAKIDPLYFLATKLRFKKFLLTLIVYNRYSVLQ